MSKLMLCALLLCAIFCVSSANAAEMAFSLSGSGWSTAGTFSGAPDGAGQWLVTSAAGQFNGVNITGVCPLGACSGVFSYDNLYFWPGPPNVDNGGIVVTLTDGDWVNFCYDAPGCALPGGYAALLWDPNSGTAFLNADNVYFGEPIPEPGTLTLMGTSALALAGVLRRRFL